MNNHLTKHDHRLLKALRIDGGKTVNVVLHKIEALKRTVIHYLKSKGDISPDHEIAIFQAETAMTPVQRQIADKWMKRKPIPIAMLQLLMKIPGEYQKIAGDLLLANIPTDPIFEAEALNQLCTVMEWRPEHREAVAKTLEQKVTVEFIKKFGVTHLLKVLMWSATPAIRERAASKCIPYFTAKTTQPGALPVKFGRAGLRWVKLWAGDDIDKESHVFLPAKEPTDNELMEAIRYFYS